MINDLTENDDKRRHLRLPRPYRVQARELVFPIAKDPLIDSQLSDISKGGLCIESPIHLEPGSRMHISVHIPLLNKFTSGFYKVYENEAEQYFQAIADVSWSRPSSGAYLIGLHFVNFDEQIAEGLDRLINKAFSQMR